MVHVCNIRPTYNRHSKRLYRQYSYFYSIGFVIPSLGKKPGPLIVIIGQCVVPRVGRSVKAMDISVYDAIDPL